MFARRPSKRNDPEAATGATATARGLPVLQAQSGSVSIMNEVLSFFHGTEKQVHGGGLLDGASTNTPQGAATIPESIYNLVKSIVGLGVLSLPNGIATFGNSPAAIIPAMILTVLMGAISAVSFSWIAETCAMTRSSTYRQAWSRTVSEESSWIPAVSITLTTFGGCVAFSMAMGDNLTALLLVDRTTVIWLTTIFVFAPLCWMKNLKNLAPFSLLGVLGIVYTAIAMTVQYFRGSYLDGSPLLEEVALDLRPSFGSEGWQSVFKPNSIILISMLSTAYKCHVNAPKFYFELKDNTMSRFNTVVATSFGISIALTAWITAVGFATFGKGSSGLILNNYATRDVLMSASRTILIAALIPGFPLIFTGLRDGVLDMLKIPVNERTNQELNKVTVGLLLVITILATKVKDGSLVMVLNGATFSTLVAYVYPAIMFGKACPAAKIPAAVLGMMGVVLGIIGAVLALQK